MQLPTSLISALYAQYLLIVNISFQTTISFTVQQVMRAILSRLTSSQKITHFRIQFPLRTTTSQKLITALNQVSSKSPAIFLSLNGFTEDAELCNSLRSAFKQASTIKSVPLYSFLQDNVNGLTYYLASAACQIHANPFCKIGDLTGATKSYENIQALLKLFGVDFQNIGTGSNTLWDPKLIPGEKQVKTTGKWLNVISQRLTNTLLTEKRLESSTLQALRSSLIHPKKALQLKLINSISSLEQFRSTNFPNNNLIEKQFTSKGQQGKITQQELKILTQMGELLEMPKVVLAAMEDPISSTLKKQFIQIVQRRMEDEEQLRSLDVLAGRVLQKLRLQSIDKLIA